MMKLVIKMTKEYRCMICGSSQMVDDRKKITMCFRCGGHLEEVNDD